MDESVSVSPEDTRHILVSLAVLNKSNVDEVDVLKYLSIVAS